MAPQGNVKPGPRLTRLYCAFEDLGGTWTTPTPKRGAEPELHAVLGSRTVAFALPMREKRADSYAADLGINALD